LKAKLGLVLVLIPVWLCISSPASAQTVYLGLKGGYMFSGVDGMDESTNIGLLVGYNFGDILFEGTRYGSLAAELEGTTTLIEGDVTIPQFFDGTWTLNSAALWLAYRTPHFLYAKGKVGLEYVDLSVDQFGNDFEDSGFGLSWGVGGGWRITESYSLEAEYAYKTNIELAGDEGDVYFLSLGMNFNF